MSNARFGFVWTGVAALAGILGTLVFGGRPLCSQERAAKSDGGEGESVADKTAFYCNLNAMSATERLTHLELTTKLTHAKLETKELADGYAFRLAGDSVSVVELGEWVAAERKCCPFFEFEIEAEQDNGALWLKLRGREGVKPFIQSELGIAR